MIEEIEREEIYDFLEHVGVKGMRWGQRKVQTSGGSRIGSGAPFSERSGRQKAAIIGTAVASAVAMAHITPLLRTPLRVAGAGAAAVVGIAAAKAMLDNHGSKKVSAPPSKAAAKVPKPPKITRAEKKQLKFAAAQKKAEDLFNAGAKNPNDLILLNGRQVVTGREFTQHMVNGGLMDINTTRVYARQKTKTGPYILEK